MTTTAIQKKPLRPDKIWKPEKDIYSANEVIDAYFQGKEDQKNQEQQILAEKFSQNLNLAAQAADALLALLKDLKYKVSDIWLNPETLTTFSSMLIVEEDDYIKEEFTIAYTKAREVKKLFNNDTFTISFSYIPSSPKLNLTSLHSDGFYLRYAKITGKA